MRVSMVSGCNMCLQNKDYANLGFSVMVLPLRVVLVTGVATTSDVSSSSSVAITRMAVEASAKNGARRATSSAFFIVDLKSFPLRCMRAPSTVAVYNVSCQDFPFLFVTLQYSAMATVAIFLIGLNTSQTLFIRYKFMLNFCFSFESLCGLTTCHGHCT